MVERDENHRPKATRNAGAFLNPSSGLGGGMIPVPSDILDRYWGRRETKGGTSRLAMNMIAVVGAIVIVLLILWALTPSVEAGLLLVVG